MSVDSSHSKLTNGLAQTLGEIPGNQQVSVIVRYTPQRRIMRHREQVDGVREGYHYRLNPLVQVFATPEAVDRLAGDPDVLRIYEDLPVHAFLDSALPKVRVPMLWDLPLTGEGVSIAIIDTGIDSAHPDLAGRIADVVDLTGEGLGDGNGHGTHCAGIAAGSGAASGGRYRGVASAATIYAAKVLRASGDGMMSDVMAGVEWALSQGARIISLSLGHTGPSNGTDLLCETCDAAVEQGCVVVAAAGNDGPLPRTVGSPGASRRAITVGASDDQDAIASFSSRGPTSDGRQKPDLVAPGVSIIAARAKGTNVGPVIDEWYASASGTSMATPLVAGVVALLLQADPSLTPAEIKQRLQESAVDIGQGPYVQGRGRLDAWGAYQAELTPTPPDQPSPPDGSGPALGEGCLTALLRAVFLGRQ
jgi:serine protease AprX